MHPRKATPSLALLVALLSQPAASGPASLVRPASSSLRGSALPESQSSNGEEVRATIERELTVRVNETCWQDFYGDVSQIPCSTKFFEEMCIGNDMVFCDNTYAMAFNEAEATRSGPYWYLWFNPEAADCQWNFNVCG
jgi:hypothetical protein